MNTKFDDLCKQLGVDALNPLPSDLATLVNWCEMTLSSDRQFPGSVQERFTSYQQFITLFLEDIQPFILIDDLLLPLPQFSNMTALACVVDQGLDRCLYTLNPSSEQINTQIHGSIVLQIAAARGYLHTTEVLLSLGANPEQNSSTAAPLLFTVLRLPINHDENTVHNKQLIYEVLSTTHQVMRKERNRSGDTIVHMMAIYGYHALVHDVLISDKELISIPNHAFRYPIHAAILNAQPECVKTLITVTGVGELTDAQGRNALHYAAQYGNEEMVKICLNSALSKDSIDKGGQTPLIIATIAGNSAAVNALIDSCVKVNQTDSINNRRNS